MPTRRDVVGMLMATAAGTFLRGPGNAAGGVVQPQHDRRRVVIGGRAIRVIDMHAHCVIPVTDIVQGTPLASSGGGRGGSILGPERLQLMDQQGVDVQALSINGYWWYAADLELARRIVRAQNEGLAKWVAKHPDRFVALASVALQHPELAAEQLEDARQAARSAWSVDRRARERRGSLAAEVRPVLGEGGRARRARVHASWWRDEHLIKEGAFAGSRRPRQHHRQSARDDVLPVTADLRRDAGQVPRHSASAARTRADTCRRTSAGRRRRAWSAATRTAPTRRSRAST